MYSCGHWDKLTRKLGSESRRFAADIPKKQLYEYESGRIFPLIEKFIKICKCLNKSATYILSPLLELSHSEQEILYIFEDIEIKEILKDKEIANTLKFTLLGFQILYKTKEHFKDNGDVINYLNIINTKLFEEGQLNKLK